MKNVNKFLVSAAVLGLFAAPAFAEEAEPETVAPAIEAGTDMSSHFQTPNGFSKGQTVPNWTLEMPQGGNPPYKYGAFFEFWSDNQNATFNFYTDATELPDGIYTMEAALHVAQPFSNDNLDATDVVGLYVNNGISEAKASATKVLTVDADPAETVKTESFIVLGGKITLGVKTFGAGKNFKWFYASDFKLTYEGALDLESVQSAANVLAPKADDLLAQDMDAESKSALEAATNAVKNGNDVESLATAITALLKEMPKAEEAIESYKFTAAILAAIDNDENLLTLYPALTGNAKTAWSGASGAYATIENCAERYYDGKANAFVAQGDILTQTLTGLPEGTYEVSFEYATSYTSGRGFDCLTGEELVYAFANDAEVSANVADVADHLITADEITKISIKAKVAADGILKYGLKNNVPDAAGNWFLAKAGSVKFVVETPGEEEGGEENPTALFHKKNVKANNAIFNMQGQKMNKLQRGINIVGGKKILVK